MRRIQCPRRVCRVIASIDDVSTSLEVSPCPRSAARPAIRTLRKHNENSFFSFTPKKTLTMNPTAVMFSVTVILSLAAASNARLDTRSISVAALRGQRLEWAHAVVPGQIARSLRFPSGRHGPRPLRLGRLRHSAAAVRFPATESTDGPRLAVLWRENKWASDISGFWTAREVHEFGSENAKRRYGKEIRGRFVGRDREFPNRF